MGTNFFIAGWADQGKDDMDPSVHIGKRSAAGQWCWDCGVALCVGGTAGVHQGTFMWHPACPKCDATPERESLSLSSVGRELGFNRAPPQRKTGVQSCSSFTWAMPPAALEGVAEIEDEYGQCYSRAEFMVMLEECPIQFFESIGTRFS